MSKFSIPTVIASCPACGDESSHRVTFENKEVRHLRCESCAAVHVCAYKGSFHSTIHPLGFAEVADPDRGDDCAAYRSTNTFQPTDVFKHPSFGLGYVVAVISSPKKMEVMFVDKVRVLVCGPGSGVPIVPENKVRRKAR